MVKGSNCVPAVKDKLVEVFWDLSSGITNTGKPIFVDPLDDYEVVSVDLVVSVTYVASQAVTLSAGVTAGPSNNASSTKFLSSKTMGTTQVAAGVAINLLALSTTSTDNRLLPKGAGLVLTSAGNGSQTGEGVLVVRLRPLDRARGNISKRPGASAQATS